MAPLACFAIFPVSRIRGRPPTSTVTRCGAGVFIFSDIVSSFGSAFGRQHFHMQGICPCFQLVASTGPRHRCEEKKQGHSREFKKNEPDYTTRNSGATSAGCLTTDSAGNLSLHENAVDIVLFQRKDRKSTRLNSSHT